MKFEFSVDWKRTAIILAMVCVAFWTGFFSGQSMNTESKPINYLTTADLNRSDIGASIVLSRFCEGMGLQSSVIWQQDSQGNEYGLPICLKKG